MPDVKKALSNVRSLLSQLKPYEYYAPDAYRNLVDAEKLLESPTKENIEAALQKLEALRKTVASYADEAPHIVNPILKQIDETRKAIR